MRKIIITIAVVATTIGTLTAAEQTDVMATVNQLVTAFNQGDNKALLSLCTDDMSIIDEFPPHEWDGPGACAKWLADYGSDAKKNGITDGAVSIGKPRHLDVTGDRAYVVVPANYSYKENGKPKKETNASWTFALQKVDAGWRVTGWAWAKQ